MTPHTVHAARPGLTGDHRTDGIRCSCDPWHLVDVNEPGRAVIVHRPMYELAESRVEGRRQVDPATGSASVSTSGNGRPGGGGSILGALVPGPLARARNAGNDSGSCVTRPELCTSKVQR